MYRTLAFQEDAYVPKQTVFSVDGLRQSKIETIQGHNTSRRTLLICSLILISTTGLLATWIFIAKPHFYPKINIVHRGIDQDEFQSKNEYLAKQISNEDIRHRGRRNVENLSSSELSSNGKQRFRRKASSHKSGRENKKQEENKKRENIKAKKFNYHTIVDKGNYPYNNSRLPLDLIPERYFIHLNIDLRQDNLTGVVKMKVLCEKKTNKVIFHGRRIIPTNITVMSGLSAVLYSRVTYIKQFEMFVVELDSNLEEDKMYDVVIEYTVAFGKSLAGVYKSFYKDNGIPK